MYKLANPSLSVSQVESLLKTNTKDLGSKGWDKYYGYGQPKLSKAATKQGWIKENNKWYYYINGVKQTG